LRAVERIHDRTKKPIGDGKIEENAAIQLVLAVKQFKLRLEALERVGLREVARNVGHRGTKPVPRCGVDFAGFELAAPRLT